MNRLSQVLALLCVIFCAAPAFAANLVLNPDFDNGLTDWTLAALPPCSVTVNNADGSDSAPSANLFGIVLRSAKGSGCAQMSQCISLASAPPPPWDAGVRVRDTSGSNFPPFQGLLQFSDADCGTSPTFGATVTLIAGGTVAGVQGAFTQQLLTGIADPLPGGGPSRSVLIKFNFSGNGISTSVNLDKVYFGPPGTTPVELSHFEVE